MKNNILNEIKNELMSKGDEPRIDNLEQYISQNKMFTILFVSKIIPDFSSILTTISRNYENIDSIKLMICICEEAEEDFNEVLSNIKDISCLVFIYESKNRQNLISLYNIISLPTLIVLDKDAVLIASLNLERIMNLNESIIRGWINVFTLRNLFKNKTFVLGDVEKLSVHAHELVFSNQSMKPGYGTSGWICDLCRAHFTAKDCNFFCAICGWDICNACYNKYKND